MGHKGAMGHKEEKRAAMRYVGCMGLTRGGNSRVWAERKVRFWRLRGKDPSV